MQTEKNPTYRQAPKTTPTHPKTGEIHLTLQVEPLHVGAVHDAPENRTAALSRQGAPCNTSHALHAS